MAATKTWSTEQNAVFDWMANGKGNLVVRARAGTGKTTTILEGIGRAPEKSILLAAFNKSIANELQSRVPSGNVEAKTLHSLGFKYIRRHANVRMDENGKRAIDLATRACPSDVPKQILNLVSKLHTKARDVEPWLVNRPALDLAGFAAHFDLLPDEDWEKRGWGIEQVAAAAHKAMKLAMERTPVIDFADMIFLPLVHGWVTPWYDMVVVDEAQDMTIAQLALAVGSCRRSGRIVVVGDDRQCIYQFRGATLDGIDRLRDELKAVEMGLTTTYRCAKSIVELAATIVPDYKAADSAPQGTIVDMSYDKAINAISTGDFVLSRKNAPLVRTCLALLKRGVRAQIKGRAIGRGIIALIRKLAPVNVDALPDLLNAWTAREAERARKKLPEDAAAEYISLCEDQAAVIMTLCDDAETIADLERNCDDLFSDDAEKASVMLSTVHRAKGLETDTVYLLRDTFREGTIEEMNIQYVAITRAKTKLVWVDGEA